MRQELKICLSGYKLAYSLLFMIFLSLVRGISSINEIGVAIVPYLAVLSAVFCTDIYLCERNAKRGEVFSLLPLKNRIKAVYRRIAIHTLYLWGVGAVGFLFFFHQQPVNYGDNSVMQEYGWYLLVMIGNVLFWSLFSMTITTLVRSQFAGIGCSVVLWLLLYSKWGERLLGNYNLFSYVFRDMTGSMEWVYGSVVEIILSAFLIGMIPKMIKKRG